uniref:Ribonuclease H-like domain-containing protein n=1 Tax=Tanacetum cinerariifolium TaxID=118510 RepID=A0A6L2JJA5_TANCI|nr:ribonuclease H-like domain-containing protein [Tanacetum cinerariifolium]
MPKSNKENKIASNYKCTTRISVRPCCFSNPHPSSPPTDYQTAPPSSLNVSPPLSLITTLGISPSKLLLTLKSFTPPLTSPLLAPTQPSKHSSPITIHLDPVEIIFSTPPTSPHAFFDSLEDLPPRTTNPPPPRPLFESIEHWVILFKEEIAKRPFETIKLQVSCFASPLHCQDHTFDSCTSYRSYSCIHPLCDSGSRVGQGSFKKHNELMKLIQFLMGLDDSYMQIRSSILSREVLPDVRSAYATISNEKSHRVASRSINLNSRPRPNNLNNNRQGGGSGLVYENCGFNGHAIERCFKIIRYLVDFGKKKPGQNFKGKIVSNNNFVGTSSSSGFTNEMATLISLIKDNKIEKNLQDNMADINHINFFDGEYPEMPSDDERVDLNLNSDNKSQSNSSHSSMSGGDVNTADFLYNSGNDADSSEDIFATQNEKVSLMNFSKQNGTEGPSMIMTP